MGNPSQWQAYDYQQRIAKESNDWSEQRNFEDRPDNWRGGKPTQRSRRWRDDTEKRAQQKQNQSQTQIPDKEEKIPDFKAKKETPEAEPSFDVGYYQASVPVKERYCQNYDHSGFVALTECIYEEFIGLDQRVAKSMPYSAFLHTMGNVLNAHILDRDTSLGNRPLGTSEYASDLFREFQESCIQLMAQ